MIRLISLYRYGYIGDVTSTKERTVMIAILGGLGFVMMPLADFFGGQIYKIGGFLPVYLVSLGFVFVGLLYIWLIPESIAQRSHTHRDKQGAEDERSIEGNICKKLWTFFSNTNKLLLETFKFIFRYRVSKPNTSQIVFV